jgi:DNA-binding transcriptional LysR family regulator
MHRLVGRTPDGVAQRDRRPSLLGTRIPLISLIQALSVAEHLNFRRAATSMGVSQSAVSLRIKQLEEDLGVLLFERQHRGVRLTEAGRYFLDHVATGIEHLDHAVRTAGAIANGEQGRLRVGLYSPIAAGFLGELLHRFRQLHPAVDLRITEGRARDTIHAVREEQLDVSFVLGVPSVEDCRSKPLWRENLIIALPQQHRLASREGVRWTELAEETFLVRREGSGPQLYDHIVLRLADHWREPRVERFDVGRDTLMTMVSQGYGLTLTSEAIMQILFPGVVFRPLLDEPEPITFSAVWSPHNRSRALHDLLTLAQRRGRANGFRFTPAEPAAPSQRPDPSP